MAGAPACCWLRPFGPRKPAKCRRSGSPRATVSNALLIAALALSLAGCGVLQPGTAARTTPPPRADTKGAHELASAPKPPEAPPRPVPPVPQQPRRTNETKPPPATASKGAEKLVAPNAPAPVRASEKPIVKAEPVEPKAPITEASDTVTDTPVTELVFKGPPRQARPRLAAKTVLIRARDSFVAAHLHCIAVVGVVLALIWFWLARQSKKLLSGRWEKHLQTYEGTFARPEQRLFQKVAGEDSQKSWFMRNWQNLNLLAWALPFLCLSAWCLLFAAKSKVGGP